MPHLRRADPVPEALGSFEQLVKEWLIKAGCGEISADFLLDKLKAEWKAEDQRPTHECTFDLEGQGCYTCGISYEEWIRRP